MTETLELQILSLLEKQPGQTAQKIAESIGVDKANVSNLLYFKLSGKVKQDSKYQWYLVTSSLGEESKNSFEQLFADTD